MGYALADCFARKGAKVFLVSGPSAVYPEEKGVEVIPVVTAAEMYEACAKLIGEVDIAVFAAAVADFTPEQTAEKKIKRGKDDLTIKLTPTKDIAAEMGRIKKDKQVLVGFALETEEGLENAKGKLERKNLDLIILNSLEDKGAGFGTDTNKITMIDKSGNIDKFELKLKSEVALDIVDKTLKLLNDA